jgi:DNA-binding HxlR family transcriptional regulator
MATKRSYGDPCGVARALDLVGDRWALLVVRELVLGPKRFTDLRAGLPHLSPDVLSQRLRELEQSAIVRRSKLPPPAGSRVYELTEWGQELEPVVLALGRWGSRAPFPPTDSQLSADSTMIALKTLFAPSAADGLTASYELRLGEHRFHATVDDGRLALVRGTAERPDATIEVDAGTLAAVLWHGEPLDDALRSGTLEIEGDRHAVERFLGLFPAPVPAAAAVEPLDDAGHDQRPDRQQRRGGDRIAPAVE